MDPGSSAEAVEAFMEEKSSADGSANSDGAIIQSNLYGDCYREILVGTNFHVAHDLNKNDSWCTVKDYMIDYTTVAIEVAATVYEDAE